MGSKLKLSLVTGGYSREAEVSYKSAKEVQLNLSTTKYEVYWVDITLKNWVCVIDKKKYLIDKNDFSIRYKSKKIKFDVAFICLHGTPGEDGKLQAYFELIGLPFTCCQTTSAALTFNKRFTNAVVSMAGIQVSKSFHIVKGTKYSLKQIATSLKFPVFVKPNNGGSSYGISKISSPHQLSNAIKKAFVDDDQIIIEEAIKGKEYSIGCYAYKNQIIPLPPIEIIPKNAFFDYNAKYNGESQEICPASMPKQLQKKLEKAVILVFKVLLLKGVARADFILEDDSQEFYFLEVNTIPGQTKESLVPKEVRAMGLTLASFYDQLIETALNE